ncbi:MAG: hypothetical protein U1E21_00265 [Reyranellaceae bacterium]
MVQRKELSGPIWVARFPGSRSLDDLVDPFKGQAKALMKALLDAGCTVTVASTFRPPERAWLMHHSAAIVGQGMRPEDVPVHPKIDIEWVHRDDAGRIDRAKSRSSALQMVQGYQIDPSSPLPALASRHTEGKAIDMAITWSGILHIRESGGAMREIAEEPRTGLNSGLQNVGRGYGVIKALFRDDPHWSSDGH